MGSRTEGRDGEKETGGSASTIRERAGNFEQQVSQLIILLNLISLIFRVLLGDEKAKIGLSFM
jgi:hypothetical protein